MSFSTLISPAGTVTPTPAGAVPDGIAPIYTANQDFYISGADQGLGGDTRGLKFGANGDFYVLEGIWGGHRIQRFSGAEGTLGQPLGAWSLGPGTGAGAGACAPDQDPFDFAVDSTGAMWVSYSSAPTFPYAAISGAGFNGLLRIAPGGARQKIAFPPEVVLQGGMGGIDTYRTSAGVEKIALVARQNAGAVFLLDLDGTYSGTVTLSRTVNPVCGLLAGAGAGIAGGDFLFQTGSTDGSEAPSCFVRFNAAGAFAELLGAVAGDYNGAPKGSIFTYGACLDSQNRLYALDRLSLVRLGAPDGSGDRGLVVLRTGQLGDQENWNNQPFYTHPRNAVAVSPVTGGIWIMPLTQGPNQNPARAYPYLLRLPADFLDVGGFPVRATALPYKSLKSSASISSPNYGFTAHSLAPFPFRLHLSTSVSSPLAAWKAVDAYGVKVAGGVVAMPGTPDADGVRSGFLDLAFTPPRYGSYTVQCRFLDGAYATNQTEDYNPAAPDGETGISGHDGVLITTAALHIAVARTLNGSPPGGSEGFHAMPTLAAPAGTAPGTQFAHFDGVGGGQDPLLCAWSGLELLRLDSTDGNLAAKVQACVDLGVGFIVSFDKISEHIGAPHIAATIAAVQGVVGPGGVIPVSLVNEPDQTPNGAIYLTGPGENNPHPGEAPYLSAFAAAATQIKALAPGALIVGPNLCTTNLVWTEKFLAKGMGQYLDAWGQHFYDGHEGIDVFHYRRAYLELRAVFAAHGLPDLPIWQTERCYDGYRNGNHAGLRQANEVLNHFDLGQECGTPGAHNYYFYASERGFDQISTPLWRGNGPMAAACAMRERAANLGGATYESKLDFGATGRDWLLGHLYRRASGEGVVVLATQQGGALLHGFEVGGGVEAQSLLVCDAFGNTSQLPVVAGRIEVSATTLNQYLHLPAGVTLTPDTFDLGPNLLQNFVSYVNGNFGWTVQNPPTWSGGDPGGGEHGLLYFGFTPTRGNRSYTLPGEYGGYGMVSLPFPADNGGYGPESQNETLTWTFDSPQTVGSVAWLGQEADNGFTALRDFDVEVFEASSGDWVSAASVRNRFPASDRVRLKAAGSYDSVSANSYGDSANNFLVRFSRTYQAQSMRVRVLDTTRGCFEDRGAWDGCALQWGGAPPPLLTLAGLRVYASNAGTTAVSPPPPPTLLERLQGVHLAILALSPPTPAQIAAELGERPAMQALALEAGRSRIREDGGADFLSAQDEIVGTRTKAVASGTIALGPINPL